MDRDGNEHVRTHSFVSTDGLLRPGICLRLYRLTLVPFDCLPHVSCFTSLQDLTRSALKPMVVTYERVLNLAAVVCQERLYYDSQSVRIASELVCCL